jgi:inner membrane protein
MQNEPLPSVLIRLAGERLRASLLFRLLATGFLVLLLQIPIAHIDGAIRERPATRDEAAASVTRTFGGQQTLVGPVLVVPVIWQAIEGAGKPVPMRGLRFILPDQLQVEARAAIEVRRRGIFDVPVYVTPLRLQGKFELGEERARAVRGQRQLVWAEAQICYGLTDPRAIQDAGTLTLDGGTLPLRPGTGACDPLLGSGVHAALPPTDANGPADTLAFSNVITVRGSQRLGFVPVGASTEVRVQAPWPDPSFDGAFLPAAHHVDGSGFTAEWRVPHLARNFPTAFDAGDVAFSRLAEADFGVSLLSPVDAYRTTERAVKYQLLFLGLTATLFFLLELMVRLRVHPVQYLLIGLGLVLFYLLLLSLSEHLGFDQAYAVAATAITALVTIYGRSVLRSRKRALTLGGLLAALYGLLFVLLQIQDYALLAGSLALLGALAAIMFVTRRVDWYGPGPAPLPEPPFAPPPEPAYGTTDDGSFAGPLP